ncbi:nucleotidyltransferase [Ornithinibacillus gellani]|uniref:nucleotidyltransferase n=1 Tax=Ornithinibacillus gellani TaxID=2293253 RepID=UPI000F4A25FF|nr:nucleotidyltransferase [Ornithinibacillus gellani]TQS75668.1 nucleotidyltransferase [Ornithinibacillus gellani]
MNACGLIVEYNPFHNGHVYHLQEAKKVSNADCMIAVMSGSFLQRGEPAIVDKFHRAQAALQHGVDIVLELPYMFAVQSSKLFAKGAISILQAMDAHSVCFGSESGNIQDFTSSLTILRKNQSTYDQALKRYLATGISYPEASKLAYQKIGLTEHAIDLGQPNNILGFSYIRAIFDHGNSIEPLTIKRSNSHYHDTAIQGPIASATSIREALFLQQEPLENIFRTMPNAMKAQLQRYHQQAGAWHDWESYFDILQYRVLTTPIQELATIQGMDEGIEHRIKKTARSASNMVNWMEAVKTKRYTRTRIQRIFTHILTNTKKMEYPQDIDMVKMPYIRLVGLTKTGEQYLHDHRKKIDTPIVSSLGRNMHPMLEMEERASRAYYSILPATQRQLLFKQELNLPIRTN